MKANRRDFIKTTTAIGAGAALAFSPLGKVTAGVQAGKKVRLAFIGTGGRGQHLLEHLLTQQLTNEYDVVAFCDIYEPSIKKTEELCKRFSIQPKVYRDHTQLIKNSPVDGVVIATPLFAHAHIAIDCMKAGIHVLCEKSMARTLDEVKAMYDAHVETGSILLIGHQRLFSQRYLQAMDRIHEGELGTVGQIRASWHRNNNWRRKLPENAPQLERQINWRLYKEYSAGLLTELMSHQLQVSNWALQQTPVSVMATGSIRYWKDGREVPDNVAAIFSYADGTQFVYDSMTSNKKYGCEEQIMGDKATMQLETNVLFAEKPPAAPGILQMVNDIEKGIFNAVPIGGASWAPETAVKYNGEPIYSDQEGDGTREELVAFIGFIQQKSMPEWIIKEGYYTSIWTLLTEHAIDTGAKISMPERYAI